MNCVRGILQILVLVFSFSVLRKFPVVDFFLSDFRPPPQPDSKIDCMVLIPLPPVPDVPQIPVDGQGRLAPVGQRLRSLGRRRPVPLPRRGEGAGPSSSNRKASLCITVADIYECKIKCGKDPAC